MIPQLPVAQYPSTVLAAQVVLAIILASTLNKGQTVKAVASFALSTLAIYVAYHDKSYLTAPLLLAMAVIVIPQMSEGYSQILVPKTDVYVGCEDVKMTELLALFDNDEAKLRKALVTIGAPSIKLNDENAPLLATYLIQHKNKVSGTCKLPVRSMARGDEIDAPVDQSEGPVSNSVPKSGVPL